MHGSIRKAKEGGYVADVRVNGRRRQLKAATKKEAEKLFSEALQEILEGNDSPKVQRRSKQGNRFTIGQALELSMRVRWNSTASAVTNEINGKAAMNWFGQHFPLEELSPAIVHGYREHLMKQGNKNTTINKKVICIGSMVGDAIEHGMIKTRPAMPKPLPTPPSHKRGFTHEQVRQFLQEPVSRGRTDVAMVFVFLMDTCSRWGDLEKLRAKDVDVAGGTVTFWKTKNGKARTVPLSAGAATAARYFMPPDQKALVFPFSYDQIEHQFNITKKNLGLADDNGLTLHSFRHTSASRMTANGVPQMKAMKFGGWTDGKSFARYNHLDTNELQDCADLMAGFSSSALGDELLGALVEQ